MNEGMLTRFFPTLFNMKFKIIENSFLLRHQTTYAIVIGFEVNVKSINISLSFT